MAWKFARDQVFDLCLVNIECNSGQQGLRYCRVSGSVEDPFNANYNYLKWLIFLLNRHTDFLLSFCSLLLDVWIGWEIFNMDGSKKKFNRGRTICCGFTSALSTLDGRNRQRCDKACFYVCCCHCGDRQKVSYCFFCYSQFQSTILKTTTKFNGGEDNYPLLKNPIFQTLLQFEWKQFVGCTDASIALNIFESQEKNVNLICNWSGYWRKKDLITNICWVGSIIVLAVLIALFLCVSQLLSLWMNVSLYVIHRMWWSFLLSYWVIQQGC